MTVDQWLGVCVLAGVVGIAVSEIMLWVKVRRIAGVVFKVKDESKRRATWP